MNQRPQNAPQQTAPAAGAASLPTDRLRALAALNQIIATSLEDTAVLAQIAAVAAGVTRAALASFWVLDEGGAALGLRASSAGTAQRDAPLRTFQIGQGAVGWVAAQRRPLAIADVLADDRIVARDWWVARGLRSFFGVPVLLEGSLLAVLALAGREPLDPGPDDRAFLEILTAQAALAIRKAGLLAESETRRRTAEALAEMGRIVTEALDPDVAAHRIAHGLRVLLGAQVAAVFQVQPATGHQVALAVSGDVGPALGDRPVLPPGAGVVGLAVAERRPVFAPDLLADPRITLPPDLRAGLAQAPFRAVLAVPLLARDEVMGALTVGDRPGRAFDPEEIRLAQAFAAQAAIAIQNARLYRQEQARRRQVEAVREVSAEIIRELDLPTLLRLIHERAAALVGTSAGTVWLWDEAAGVLVPQSWSGHGDVVGRLRLGLGEGLAGIVAQRREGLIVNDYRTSPYAHSLLLEHTRVTAALAEPLLYRDRLVGVITVGTSAAGRAFTEQDREILNLFAAQAAIAIENARLYRQEQERARQLAAAREVTSDLIRELDLSTLLGLIQWRAAELAWASAGAVYLWDADARTLRPQAWFGFGDWMRDVRFALGEGITGTVAQRRQGLIVNDYPNSPQANPIVLAHSRVAACVAEPLVCRDRLVGVITLTRDEPDRPFTEQDRETFSLFAAQAAIAIENARLYQAERDRAGDLAALIPAGRAIASSLDLPRILESIVASAAELASAPLAYLMLSAPEGHLAWQACAGPLRRQFEQETRAIPMPVGESFSGEVAATRQTLWVPDMTADPRTIYRDFTARHGIRCYLGVPILIGDRLLGVLSVIGPQGGGVTEGRREFLEMLAGQAALAIENARLFRQEQERRRQVEAVREVTTEIIQELDLTSLLGLITRRAAELVGAPSGAIFLWDQETQTLVPRAWVGLGDYMREVRLRLGESITGMVAQRREGMIVNDYRSWPHASPIWLEHTAITAALAEPLLYRDRLLGVITINNLGTARSFTDQDRETLALFAAQAALAIENARLYGEAEGRRREAEVLAELARDISASLDIEKLLQRVAEGAKDLCESDLAAVALREPASDGMGFRHLVGVRHPAAFAFTVERGRGAGGMVLATGRPFRTEAYAEDDRIGKEYLAVVRAEGIAAMMVVPIRGENRIEGLLYVGNGSPRRFTDRDEAILQRLADHAAIALGNVQLFAREEASRATAEASEERFRALVQDLDAIVWEAGAAPFRYTFVSQRAEAILGYPVARWLENADFAATLIHPDDRERAVALSRSGAAQGRDYGQEFRALAADGRLLWLREVVRVVRDAEDRPRRLRGVTLDITARKQAEETLREREDQLRQAQKMEAMGRLAGGVAHDFNNLMTAMMIYGDLLANSLAEDHPLRHPADQIRKVADRAAALVRQLLAFSRRQVLEPKLVDLSAVLADLEPMLHRLLGENIALVTATDHHLYRVKADPGQIEQVIINLAVNARDAMPQGGRLTIQTANVEVDEPRAQRLGSAGPGPLVLLAVTDTGVGMDADTQARVFEPFFTTKEPGKGTGLGLSTVYGIVQQHQGAIAVESAPGQGTTVRIYLPWAAGDEEGTETGRALPASPRGAETILLVEDEAAVRESVGVVLRDQGYTVLEAGNGPDALRVGTAHDGRIDLLLTDVVMPLMSGPRLARRLVQERPEVRVLYMSAYTDQAVGPAGTLEGGAPFIQKPFTQDALARKIRDTLDAPGAAP